MYIDIFAMQNIIEKEIPILFLTQIVADLLKSSHHGCIQYTSVINASVQKDRTPRVHGIVDDEIQNRVGLAEPIFIE